MRWLWTVSMGLTVACVTDSRPTRDRGAANLFDQAPTIEAPKQDRCDAHGKGKTRKLCDEAHYLAENFVRGLSTGDEVCLEGGFGEPPRGDCLARATVMDTDTNKLLLEVKGAKPDSRWFQKQHFQFWFEEGSLVDLYLQDHGY